MKRGPIPRDAFDATLDIARGAIKASPFYSAEARRIALHLLDTIENGVIKIANITPRQADIAPAGDEK